MWKDYQRWRMYDAQSLLFLSYLTSLWMRNMSRKTIKWSSGPSPLSRTVTFSKLLEIRVLAGGSLPSLPQSIPHIQCEIPKDGSSLAGNYWHLIHEIPLIVIDLVWIQQEDFAPLSKFHSSEYPTVICIWENLLGGSNANTVEAERSEQGDYALLLCCSVESS